MAGLVGGLDPLARRGEAEVAGQPGHRRRDAVRPGVLRQVGDEGAVQLEPCHRQSAQVGQRGVAGAEVVDEHADTEGGEVAQLGLGDGVAGDEGPLEQFHGEPVGGQSAAVQVPGHRRRERPVEAAGGGVDGDAGAGVAGEEAERLLQDEAVDQADEAAVLRDVEELLGQQQPASGVRPADQGLEPRPVAVAQVDDGLVVHAQLALRQGSSQVVLHGEPAVGAFAQGVGEDAAARPAGGLGGVEGGVGVAQDGPGVHHSSRTPTARGHGQVDEDETGARRAPDLLGTVRPVDADRGRQAARDAVRHVHGLRLVGQAGEDDEELVVPDPGERVPSAQADGQPLCGRRQHLVAHLDPEAVVDDAEPVEVAGDDAQPGAVSSASRGEPVGEVGHGPGPVPQPGQRVATGPGTRAPGAGAGRGHVHQQHVARAAGVAQGHQHGAVLVLPVGPADEGPGQDVLGAGEEVLDEAVDGQRLLDGPGRREELTELAAARVEGELRDEGVARLQDEAVQVADGEARRRGQHGARDVEPFLRSRVGPGPGGLLVLLHGVPLTLDPTVESSRRSCASSVPPAGLRHNPPAHPPR